MGKNENTSTWSCSNIKTTNEDIRAAQQADTDQLIVLIEQVIIGLIGSSANQVEGCVVFLQKVMNYVLHNDGTKDDVKDVLQEGMAELYLQLLEGRYPKDDYETGIEFYAYGICKFKWNNMRKKKGRTILSIDDEA